MVPLFNLLSTSSNASLRRLQLQSLSDTGPAARTTHPGQHHSSNASGYSAFPFDFNSAPGTLPSNHHLTASPSFTHVSHHSSHSHRSSISSLSRSCSPSASSSYPQTTRGHSGDQFALRGSLRSNSTSSNTSLHAYGIPVHEVPLLLPSTSLSPQSGSQGQAWRCAYPGCTSRATFTRGCDLRKHYNRHSKHLFCRVEGCPQSEAAAAGRAKSTEQPLTGVSAARRIERGMRPSITRGSNVNGVVTRVRNVAESSHGWTT